MDLITELDRSPLPGETIIGNQFDMIAGGKGANQAVAAARLGAKVTMIGCVGDDVFGSQLSQKLALEGVDTRYVSAVIGIPTGVALIQVQHEGENSIIVIPGANFSLEPSHVDAAEEAIQRADIMLLQLEIPLNVVERAVELASMYGVRIILDPAPAPTAGLPESLLRNVDLLTPNETEAALLGMIPSRQQGDILDRIRDLKEKTGVSNLVVTHGGDGVYYDLGDAVGHQPPYQVKVVDTTAAGDCFNAAIAVRWAEGASLEEAFPFAVRAAAIAVSRFGAQTSLPTRTEVERLVP